MRIILHIWRQRNAQEPGRMVRYEVPDVNHEMSFLEMLDVLNEDLIARAKSRWPSTTTAARASAACAAS
jgi:succinate dehydrogenase / fumarate reductase iron-sulfur subunit